MSDPTAGPAGLVTAGALVVLAGVFSAADAALTTYSRARAEELVGEGRPGARRLVALLDDRARYLNTALLLRLLCETGAVVLVTLVVLRLVRRVALAHDPDHGRGDAGGLVRGRRSRPAHRRAVSTPTGSRRSPR